MLYIGHCAKKQTPQQLNVCTIQMKNGQYAMSGFIKNELTGTSASSENHFYLKHTYLKSTLSTELYSQDWTFFHGFYVFF